MLDQPFCRKFLERLTHWHLTDTEIMGKPFLPQPLAGFIIPVEDGGAHLLGNNIAQLLVRRRICQQGLIFSREIRYNI